MFKMIHALTAPSSFAAICLTLALALLLTTLPLPSSVAAPVGSVPAGPVDEARPKAVVQAEEEEPVRATKLSAYQNAPPSLATAISDLTPAMEQDQKERDVAALEEVSFSLPEEGQIPYYCTQEEYMMLLWCVEGEARGKSLEHREIIAQVILNRVEHERFGSTVKEVLSSPKQFNAMAWYNPQGLESRLSPLTIEAVDAVLAGAVPDLSRGALYFCNPNTAATGSWFETSLTPLFDLENHRFYTY